MSYPIENTLSFIASRPPTSGTAPQSPTWRNHFNRRSYAPASYQAYIDEISTHRQHLRCLRGFLRGYQSHAAPNNVVRSGTQASLGSAAGDYETREDREQLTVLDVEMEVGSEGSSGERQVSTQTFPTTEPLGNLRTYLESPSPDLRERTIIVDRVTPENMALLGEIYDIDPDFFHGHLEPQQWDYIRHNDFDGRLVTSASWIRRKRFLHVDFEKLYPVRCNSVHLAAVGEKEPNKSRRSPEHDNRDMAGMLCRRLARRREIVPRIRFAHVEEGKCKNIAMLVCRNRASYYSCAHKGVQIHIYLFYPALSSRRLAWDTDPFIVAGGLARQSHMFALDRAPSFSEIHDWCRRPAGAAGHTLADILLLILEKQKESQALSSSQSSSSSTKTAKADGGYVGEATVNLALFELIASEWHITLDHFTNVMAALEDDRDLLVPRPDDPSRRLSLLGFRRLLLEYREILHETLQQLGGPLVVPPSSSNSNSMSLSSSMILPQISSPDVNSLPASASTTSTHSSSPYHATLLSEFTSLSRTLSLLIARADQAAATHMSFLSIEESRRAIQQAESMRRLTALAFVFLPLTFTTGVFGMNIVELKDGVQAWITVLIALAIAGGTGGLYWWSSELENGRAWRWWKALSELRGGFGGDEMENEMEKKGLLRSTGLNSSGP